MIDLGTLGGNRGIALSSNNHGQVVGLSSDASHHDKAVVWTNTGGGWVIEDLGTLSDECCAVANGINNGTAGDPATVAVAGSSNSRAVVWTPVRDGRSRTSASCRATRSALPSTSMMLETSSD